MAKIRIMDELLANKIAAGEVVERCSSVVKELVENSIDASATEIKVELEQAGTTLIRVIDNGIGMQNEDALLAFQRHATSKITYEDDLYHINTLGFRGEALPSIASVSDVTLKTSTGEVGSIIHIQGGKVISNQRVDARVGTIISVRDLFYNTPARLKHMKSLYAELANITDYMNKIALSNPNIRFTLTNNENTILKTNGNGDLLKTIHAIYGLDVAKGMIKVSACDSDYNVYGYISKPELHRSSRNNMTTLVNGRVVRNASVNTAINDGYHSYKPDNRYPIVVLNIEVDPSLIDVNIHPTKMDIKFGKLEELCSLISNMIKNALSKKTLIPHIEVTPKEVLEKPKYEEITLDLDRTVNEPSPYIALNEDLIVKENPSELKSDTKNTVTKTFKSEEIEELEDKKKRLPELYPVGLVHGTYIICENEKGMYLIDQHAAKERINYEFYKQKLGNPSNDTIDLLFPITIELSNKDFLILKENFDVLRNMHFDISEFGLNSVIIKSHPIWLPKGYEEDAIKRIIEVVINKEKDFTIEKFNEKVATMLSCKLAIKANDHITLLEMENLINDLRKCDNPFNCPHGRPTIIYYSNYDLEKLFKRSGF